MPGRRPRRGERAEPERSGAESRAQGGAGARRGADPPLGGDGEEGRGRGWGRERGRGRTDNGNEGGGNERATVELRGIRRGCARKGAG